MLHHSLMDCKSIKGKAALIWDFYESRRVKNSCEPIWVHKAYDLILNYLNDELPTDKMKMVYEIINTHIIPDGTEVQAHPHIPQSPVRIMHEGWKIGTPTWIFMGRHIDGATKLLNNKWIAVKRSVPKEYMRHFDPNVPDTIWLAYHLERQMGMDEKDSKCIGPSLYFDELAKEVENHKNAGE